MKRILLFLPLLTIAIASLRPQWVSPIYEDYSFTQDWHQIGAFDVKGGYNKPIYSPISGRVVRNTVDANGNTVLLITNNRYGAKLLHGNWIVAVDTWVRQGQLIGRESNNGLTYTRTLIDGKVFCGTESKCGYHTHIVVWDRSKVQIVNLKRIW